MSDKIVINASKQYLNKPINEFVKLIEETANKRYPDYKLGWITNMPESMIEEEIRETGIKNAKIIELDTDILSFRVYGVFLRKEEKLNLDAL